MKIPNDGRLAPDDMCRLLKFIDQMMPLPPEEEKELRKEIASLEKEHGTPYVTSWERFAREEGLCEGLREGIDGVLELKFGPQGREVFNDIGQTSDPEVHRTILRAALKATTLDEVRQVLPK